MTDHRPLSTIFLSGTTAPCGNIDVLEASLSALLATAHGAWPELSLPDDQFVTYLAARCPDGCGLRELHAEDLFLTCALVEGDARALAIFEERLIPVVFKALGRMRLQAAERDDVAQLLRVHFLVAEPGELPRIAEYSGRGPLASWVKVAAVRAALKRNRAKTVTLADDDATLESAAVGQDTEFSYIREKYREPLRQSFQQALASLTGRQQNLLRQHFVDGLSIDKLGRLHRVHRSTAARWLRQSEELLLERVRAALLVRFGITASECDSLLKQLRSHLDISLQ